MSILTPKPSQKFTNTTVLDRKFRLKYNLTYAQTEIISYLVMIVQSWKNIMIVDGYFVILTSKIKNDLLLHEKTIEASITKLKKLELIETTLVKVPKWESNENFRGVKITDLGKSYSLSHYKPEVHQEIADLKIENENFRLKENQLEETNMDLELKYKAIKIQMEADDNISKKAIEVLEQEGKKDKQILLLKEELKETKEQLQISMEKENQKSQNPKKKEKDLEDFRKKIVRQYSKTGEPICNAISNQDQWAKDVQFYINSYNKVSIYTGNGEFKQILEPKKIANFWAWLFAHQHRVGTLLDMKNLPDISLVLAFIGQNIVVNKKIYKIHNIEAVIGGAKIKLEDENGKVIGLNSEFGSEVIDLQRVREWIACYS